MVLIIVESPTKANTIQKLLGKSYKVVCSYGHVRDLPKSKLGIDIEHNFEPTYVIPVKARKRVNFLKKESKQAEKVILATDQDREGEAIAYHLAQILGLKNAPRIVFNEITKSAILTALKNLVKINLNLVNAQQSRRILDRLVGYKLSPFLWEKVARKLSAGRVQSVALRLIVERDQEIRNFKPTTYFTISGILLTLASPKRIIEAELSKINNRTLPKPGFTDLKKVEKIVSELKTRKFYLKNLITKLVKKYPLPPFTTSTLGQQAAKQLGFSMKKTMYLAQSLYENGLITYMRTDSVNLSKESLIMAEKWIKSNLGERYFEQPRIFKTKTKLAQEAHEAIRPTNVFNTQPSLDADQKKLYDLIWRRFVASQLPPAIFQATSLEISSLDDKYLLKASGSVLKFDGFLKIWPKEFQQNQLPELTEGEKLKLKRTKINKHLTQPPPRYTDASLIKDLEKFGIGRPSTYVPIISIIQERNYVYKQQGKFYPTEMGLLVNKILTQHFPEIVDISFTAKLEEKLDLIAQGKLDWRKVVGDFYYPFAKNLKEKYKQVKKIKVEQKTNLICEKCGRPMVIKTSRFGEFLACSGFPKCKNVKPLKEKTYGKCPKCKIGDIVERRAKTGKKFYGCSRYPECDWASWKLDQSNEKRG